VRLCREENCLGRVDLRTVRSKGMLFGSKELETLVGFRSGSVLRVFHGGLRGRGGEQQAAGVPLLVDRTDIRSDPQNRWSDRWKDFL
jgi:hypothetical protein